MTTITISRGQHELATRARPRRPGSTDRVDVQLRDYREIEGTYDAIVSIEMLEAVGAEYFATFFEVCDRALRPGGRMSLQSITFPDVAYEAPAPRRELDPDVHLPGRPAAVAGGDRAVARTGRTCSSATRRRHRAAATCGRCGPGGRASWRTSTPSGRMGFDDRFIRMWEYYLALSEAGFATGVTQDLQIVLEKGRGLAVG